MITPSTQMYPNLHVLAFQQFGEEPDADRVYLARRDDGLYYVSITCSGKMIDSLLTDCMETANKHFYEWAMAALRAYYEPEEKKEPALS